MSLESTSIQSQGDATTAAVANEQGEMVCFLLSNGLDLVNNPELYHTALGLAKEVENEGIKCTLYKYRRDGEKVGGTTAQWLWLTEIEYQWQDYRL